MGANQVRPLWVSAQLVGCLELAFPKALWGVPGTWVNQGACTPHTDVQQQSAISAPGRQEVAAMTPYILLQ